MQFKTKIEVEVEVNYTVDKELRQGDDARYPAEPCVDDVWIETPRNILTADIMAQARQEAEEHFKEEKE
jgi:hypothetical protein